MAYTVKDPASISGVSIRTLHFYDEAGLLKPAYYGANGYRFYEEPQLLTLQQILFYRDLGFVLKDIKMLLGNAEFERVSALESHRTLLEQRLTRTRKLIETVEKTVKHLKGIETMSTEDMFEGFRVGAGSGRFDERLELRREPADCKVSARDTDGAMCVFEFNGSGSIGGPRHLHRDQDEWVYVIQGEFYFEVGDDQFRASAGESVFLPRKVIHAWESSSGGPGKTINVYQPAGRIEEFFQELGKYNSGPPIHEVISFEELCALFDAHGIEVKGPPLAGEWAVIDGRITQLS